MVLRSLYGLWPEIWLQEVAVLGGTNLHRPCSELIAKRNLLIIYDLCFVTPWGSTPWRFVPPTPVFVNEK